MSSATLPVNSKINALVERCGYAAAAVTILPIPGSELVAVAPIHVGMVVRIGDCYGVDIDRDSAMKLILRIGAAVGLSLVGSSAARFAAKVLLPFAGGLIAAPMVFASTLAIGRVAQAYFERGGELSDTDMRSLYKQAQARAKDSFDPGKLRKGAAAAAPAETSDLGARLERLADLLAKGLIDAEEHAAAKAQILSEL